MMTLSLPSIPAAASAPLLPATATFKKSTCTPLFSLGFPSKWPCTEPPAHESFDDRLFHRRAALSFGGREKELVVNEEKLTVVQRKPNEVDRMSLHSEKEALTYIRDPVYSVAFSPNGEYLASGSLDKSMLVEGGYDCENLHGQWRSI